MQCTEVSFIVSAQMPTAAATAAATPATVAAGSSAAGTTGTAAREDEGSRAAATGDDQGSRAAATGDDQGSGAATAVGADPDLPGGVAAPVSTDGAAVTLRYYVNEEGRIGWRVV